MSTHYDRIIIVRDRKNNKLTKRKVIRMKVINLTEVTNKVYNMSMNELIEVVKGLNAQAKTLETMGKIKELLEFEVTYYTNRIEYNSNNMTLKEVRKNLVNTTTTKYLNSMIEQLVTIYKFKLVE